MLPKAGDIIDGKYELVSLLGQGGMGAVYKARHRTLSKECAIKVMLADAGNPEALARFEREGRAAANLHSEHIVRVVDVDQENGYAYMVLELLEGEDLSQVLDRERCLQPHVAVGYVMQALEGVKEAHSQGIVHRDLKPSNLFLARKRDGSAIIKVLDFGISKAGNANNALAQTPGARTSTKAMLGSPLYMSPEQLRSSKSVDQRADIWAIGVILFELLTGSLPFMGENLGELFAAILETEAPDVRRTSPLVPQGLAEIVTRCLQRKVETRYQNATDLLRDLAPFANPVGAGMPMQLGTAMMSPAQNPAANMRYGGSGQLMQTPSSLPGGVPSMGMPGSPAMPGGPPMGPTPGPNPYAVSRQGAITGSGAHVPVVKGTAPLGAITPQPNGQNPWPNTNDGTAVAVPKSSAMPLVIGACVVLVIAGVGLIGWSKLKGKPPSDPTTTASAALSADPTPPLASSTASASTATVASATPSASAATPASAASSAAPPAASSTQLATSTSPKPHTGSGTHSKPVEPPKAPDPPKPVEPKPAEPKVTPPNPPVKPPPKATSGVQNER